MESTHFLTLFIGLAICSLLIGLYASKHIHTQADYYLASRKVKTLPLALTLVATQIGGGLILGTADQDFGIKVSGKRALNFARLTTLVCGTVALIFAYHFDNILVVLMQSIELPISALFISIFFGCIKRRVYRTAAYLSVFTGIIAFAIFKIIDINLPTAFAPILLSLLAYLIGWWWEAKRGNKVL